MTGRKNTQAAERQPDDEAAFGEAKYRIDVELEGFNSGLMVDRYDPSMESETSTARTTKLPPREEAEARLYVSFTGSKKPVIPTVNLVRALVDAGRQFKIGKRQVSTKTDTLITGYVAIKEKELEIISEQGWHPLSMGVGVANGRKVKVRPCFPDWRVKLTIFVLPNLATGEVLITPDLLYKIFATAGQSIGLGCYRAEKGGPFGQYRLTKWALHELKKKKVA